MIRTAVILAAGRGSRLDPGGQAHEFSKPLMKVGGKTLLERTVIACRRSGAERILVVTGFRMERVVAEVERLDGGDLQAIFNPDWAKSNGLSLLACQPFVEQSFALMMADHIFEHTILGDLMARQLPQGSVVLAVDRKVDKVFDLDDATKVRILDDRIADISKTLVEYNAIDCGLFACTPAIFVALREVLARTGDCSLSEGMHIIGRQGRFLPFDIGDRWWQDVDTPAMLEAAHALLDVHDKGQIASPPVAARVDARHETSHAR